MDAAIAEAKRKGPPPAVRGRVDLYGPDEITSRELREEYLKAKTEKERFLARKAKLDLAERKGKLIDAGRSVEESRRAGIAIRDAWLAMPAKVASDLAAMDDPVEIERFLTDLFRAELTRLAEMGEGNAAG
jgi:hypothetical protein